MKLFLLLPLALVSSQPTTHFETVTRVLDGDTIGIEASWNPFPNLKWVVRVNGIDTPEKGFRAKCTAERILGDQATQFMNELIHRGDSVELRNVHHDKYGGRILADVYLNGRAVADILIKRGLARSYHGEKKTSWC